MTVSEDPHTGSKPDETPPALFADDEFYRALTARRRRRILAHLLSCDRCTVEELVDVLSGWETATSRVVDRSQATQLRIELVHRHLPMLEDAGLLTYDRNGDEVTVATLPAPVQRLVQQSIDAE